MKTLPLSKQNLSSIEIRNGLLKPEIDVFGYQEKIISFGTGVLLKGLPFYFVNKANNSGVFRGRILAVKSTPGSSEIESLKKQNFIYSLQSKGIKDGQEQCETNIMAPISRILHAEIDWKEILLAAHNPELKIVISNTTEIGLNYPDSKDVQNYPPQSFPGKLLMFLKERYNAFEGSLGSGMVIIPTELVVDNGKVLKEVLVKLAEENDFDIDFCNWLVLSNSFCNSLVDRIVTGKPDQVTFDKYEDEFGVSDPNLITSETYRLWAIEGDEKVKEKLSFQKADEGCIVEGNIEKYRELKLRLLNGSHSLMVGYSFLKGIKSVKESLDDQEIVEFMNDFIFNEIIPSLPIGENISKIYAQEVLNRFRNPNIDHKLLGITVQYSTKMKSRVIPILLNYYKKFEKIPPNITKGFAYFLKFMKVIRVENGQYFGKLENKEYMIQDLNAQFFYESNHSKTNQEYINGILRNIDLWGVDLSKMDGFEAKLLEYLD